MGCSQAVILFNRTKCANVYPFACSAYRKAPLGYGSVRRRPRPPFALGALPRVQCRCCALLFSFAYYVPLDALDEGCARMVAFTANNIGYGRLTS